MREWRGIVGGGVLTSPEVTPLSSVSAINFWQTICGSFSGGVPALSGVGGLPASPRSSHRMQRSWRTAVAATTLHPLPRDPPTWGGFWGPEQPRLGRIEAYSQFMADLSSRGRTGRTVEDEV